MSIKFFLFALHMALTNASQCGQKCGISGRDQVGGKVLAGLSPHITTKSDSQCCDLCVNHAQCTAWVRQPSTTYCWLIQATEANKTVSRDDRTVGFIQPPPPQPYPVVVKLEAFGANSIRVRVSAPGMHEVEEPIISALVPQNLDREQNEPSDDPTNLVHGNLKISVDPKFHYITATRVSDGAVLLEQTGLSFGQATPGSRPGSVSATVTFKGTDGEKMYGFGEHRTGKVQQLPYRKQFSDSLYYGKSRGSDVSIPFYTSSKGYGFLWNLPSFGHVDVSSEKIEWGSLASRGVDMWITTTPAPQQEEDQDEEKSPKVSSYGYLLHQYADAVGHPMYVFVCVYICVSAWLVRMYSGKPFDDFTVKNRSFAIYETVYAGQGMNA